MATKEKFKFLKGKTETEVTRNGVWIKKTVTLDNPYKKGMEIITQEFIGKTELKCFLNKIDKMNLRKLRKEIKDVTIEN